MNNKLNFSRFFFDSGKYLELATDPSEVADYFPVLIFTYDCNDDRITYGNRLFCTYFNLNVLDFEQHRGTLEKIIHPDDLSLARASIEKFRAKEAPGTCSFECRLVGVPRKVDQYFRIQGNTLVKGVNGKPQTMVFTAFDITDETRLKNDHRALHDLLDETEEMLEYGYWTLDSETKKLRFSAGLMRLLGYPVDHHELDLEMSFLLGHVLNGYRDGLADRINQAAETKKGFEFEYTVQSAGGQRKIFFTRAKISHSVGVAKIIGITHDISAIRNYERKQERHIRDLNRSNKELEEFAYVASHDLQEPLRKIAMFSERLKNQLGPQVNKDTELFIDRILASSASMRALIDNLLEFSRANRSSSNFETVELTKILESAIADLELKIEETGSHIKVYGEMPKIEGVPSELKQVFNNLLSNSIKFRKQDCPAEISIYASRLSKEEKKENHLLVDKSYIKLEFVDKGIGFEEEYADKIFQIFQRLHGKAEYPGSGIGLAICKKIAENHNGLIFARSKPMEGASFTIILPEKQF